MTIGDRNIRIGMASAYFALMKGGGEYYTLHLSNSLVALGYDITVICGIQPLTKPNPLSREFKIQYVPNLYFLRNLAMRDMGIISHAMGLIHTYHYTFSCYNHLLRNREFDIVHTHDPASLNAAIKAKHKCNFSVVATFHGMPSHSQLEDAKKADVVVAVSEEIKKCFERAGVRNVYHIPGGVDLSLFRPLSKDKCKRMLGLNGKVILFVGRLIPIKNIFRLIYAFKKISSKINDASLLIIGEGFLRRELGHTIKELNLQRTVGLIGGVSQGKLPLFYNAADVFVLPSLFESFPLVALEASACVTPVVITREARAFIKEFGEDSLFTVDPTDVLSIASTIAKVIENGDVAQEKAIKASRRTKRYGWTPISKTIADLYGNL